MTKLFYTKRSEINAYNIKSGFCIQNQCIFFSAFIYLLCGVKGLKDSEIAVLRYDEYAEVAHKKNFTIGIKKNYSDFYLHRLKSPKGDIPIPRNRIEKTFDYLIKVLFILCTLMSEEIVSYQLLNRNFNVVDVV